MLLGMLDKQQQQQQHKQPLPTQQYMMKNLTEIKLLY